MSSVGWIVLNRIDIICIFIGFVLVRDDVKETDFINRDVIIVLGFL